MKYNEIQESTATKEKKFSDLPQYQDLLSQYSVDVEDSWLTSLDGSPEKVTGDFDCDSNQLTTLVGGPKYVGGYFSCAYNPLTNLVGAPEYVGGDFFCGNVKFPISLLGITTREIHGVLRIDGYLTSIMELFKIRGIRDVELYDMLEVEAIVTRHITKGIRGMLPCQAELIANGFKDIL